MEYLRFVEASRRVFLCFIKIGGKGVQKFILVHGISLPVHLHGILKFGFRELPSLPSSPLHGILKFGFRKLSTLPSSPPARNFEVWL